MKALSGALQQPAIVPHISSCGLLAPSLGGSQLRYLSLFGVRQLALNSDCVFLDQLPNPSYASEHIQTYLRVALMLPRNNGRYGHHHYFLVILSVLDIVLANN